MEDENDVLRENTFENKYETWYFYYVWYLIADLKKESVHNTL